MLKKYHAGWPRLIDDQVRIAVNLLTLPIFLKEDAAKIGGVENVQEELTC